MIIREAYTWTLFGDEVDNYIRLHDDIPQHVVELYRRAGIRDIAIYRNGKDLILTLERDESLYGKMKHTLDNDPMHRKFQAELYPTHDRTVPGHTYQQIFRLNATQPPCRDQDQILSVIESSRR